MLVLLLSSYHALDKLLSSQPVLVFPPLPTPPYTYSSPYPFLYPCTFTALHALSFPSVCSLSLPTPSLSPPFHYSFSYPLLLYFPSSLPPPSLLSSHTLPCRIPRMLDLSFLTPPCLTHNLFSLFTLQLPSHFHCSLSLCLIPSHISLSCTHTLLYCTHPSSSSIFSQCLFPLLTYPVTFTSLPSLLIHLLPSLSLFPLVSLHTLSLSHPCLIPPFPHLSILTVSSHS